MAHEEEKKYPDIFQATYSILFLATPHAGSKTADLGLLMSKIATLTLQQPAKHLLETLKLNSFSLNAITQQFMPLYANLKIISFYERKQTQALKSLVI